ncbi:YcxB family protein [Streptomyces sp. NPDC056773]|uniref:YcxB family protein n=1 Tax=unclassified Streptomyces TaxID=2593676 RepID=UPI0036A04DC5
MNTGGDQPEQTEQVVFTYRPTFEDVQGAVRARARRTGAGRAETAAIPLMTAVLVTAFGLVRGVLPVVLVGGAVLSLGIGLFAAGRVRRSMARQIHSVVGQYGQCRTTADDRGAVTTGETMSFSADWKLFPRYVETPELFVLLGGSRAAAIGVLPKRGAQHPGDIDRLRAMLDRNLKRL